MADFITAADGGPLDVLKDVPSIAVDFGQQSVAIVRPSGFGQSRHSFSGLAAGLEEGNAERGFLAAGRCVSTR